MQSSKQQYVEIWGEQQSISRRRLMSNRTKQHRNIEFLIISATCAFMKNHKRMQAGQRYLRFIILSDTIPLSHPCISVSRTINNKINQRTVYPFHTFNSHLLFLLDRRKMTSGLSNVRFKWHERGIASSTMINTHVTMHKYNRNLTGPQVHD